MLSLTELRRAAALLADAVVGNRVQAVTQPDASSVVLTAYGGKRAGRHFVRLSCRPECARVSLCAERPRSAGTAAPFTQYLRAHVVGGRVEGVRVVDDDRQLALDLDTAEGVYRLLLAILGPRSNLYLLDGEGRIASTLRPLRDTRPELALGGPWRTPESRPPRAGDDRFAAEPDDRFLLAVEAAYAERERSGESEALRRRLEQALRKEARVLDRKLEKLEESLALGRAAGRLEREGELLKGHLAKVKRGDTEVVVKDYETGETLTITLEPTLSPAENLERIFKRYHKAVRSLTKSGAREEAVRAARRDTQQWIDRLEAATVGPEASDDALAALAEEAPVRRLVEKYAPAASRERRGADAKPTEHKLGKHVVPGRLMPRRYRTAGELEIWVGRSAAGNDHLSLRLARGKDLFFHLDGAPGSHVILRTDGRADPPSEAVLDACELAVHFSKFKNATRADVHAVPIANVRKPKGAKPGLVSVHGGKTIHLRRTEARLERILAARIE